MLRSLLKANIAYAVGSAANSAAMLLLVPFLVNVLPPDEYGVWVLFEVAIVLLSMLMMAGLDIGLMRGYWSSTDETWRARLVGTILIAVMVWSGALVAVGLVLLAFGIDLALPSPPHLVIGVLFTAWVEAVFLLLLTLFRIREKPAQYVTLSVGRMALFMAGAIGMAYWGQGVPGVLAGRFLAAVIALVAAGILSARWIVLRPDWDALRRAARYGLPMMPTNLAIYVLFASDRYVLQRFATLESVAVYTFAYKIATTLDVLVTRPFAVDWAPRRFKIAVSADAPRQYALVLAVYLLVGIGFFLLIVAITPTIYQLFAPPVYWSGMNVVPVILVAYLIYGLSHPLNVGILIKDRTEYVPLIGGLAAAMCITLNFWWIPAYGMMGAAWASVVSYSVFTAGIAWTSLRLYAIPYPLRQVAWSIAFGGIGYAGLWLIDRTLSASAGLLSLTIKMVWVALMLGVSGYPIWRGVQAMRRSRQGAQLEPKTSS